MLATGVVLQGRYRITGVLGIGGMGAVYLAQDSRLGGRPAAVKELAPDPNASLAEQARMQQQFQTEAVILGGLSHPNLPKVHDCFIEAGLHYLVMDYVDGETLQDILDHISDFLTESQVLQWAGQICDVLTYLHGQRPPVIFRDLKPSNIMVDRRGTIKLIDFGIVRLFKPGQKTDTSRLGTEGYAPPEQYTGQGQTDARSDIYSLGATLHHLLTRRDPTQHPPFSCAMAPVRCFNPVVSPTVEAAVARALAYDRADRFQSVAEMKQALLASAALQLPTVLMSRRARSVWPTFLAISTAIFVVGLGATLLRVGATQPTPTPLAARQSATLPSSLPITMPTAISSTPTPVPTATEASVSAFTPVETRPQLPSSTSSQAIIPTVRPTPTPTAISASPMPKPVGPASAGTISFHSDRGGNDDIYIMKADGSNQRRLTNDPASDLYPALSPNGQRIAFVTQRDGNPEIYVINSDGSQETRLTFEPREDRLPTWSPDGTKIAFNSDRAGNLDLWVMNSDGSSLMRLTSGQERDGHATWSPNGQWLAFNAGFDDSTWEIHVISATGRDLHRLTTNSVIDWSPSWSPNGSRILFLSKRSADPAIYVMTVDGSDQRQVLGGLGSLWGAVWSPDSQYVAFTSDRSGRDEIYVAKSDGSGVKQLTYEGGAYPSWSN